MNIFNNVEKVKNFCCEKILPAVYDDSLSYYEVLCKLTSKCNQIIDEFNKVIDYSDETLEKATEQANIAMEKATSANESANIATNMSNSSTESATSAMNSKTSANNSESKAKEYYDGTKALADSVSGSVGISDSQTTPTTTWSSNKIDSEIKGDLEPLYDIITRGVTSYTKKIVFPFVRGNLNLLTGAVTEYENLKALISKDYVTLKSYEEICVVNGYRLKWVSYEKTNDIYTYNNYGIIYEPTCFTDGLPRKFMLERVDGGDIDDTEFYKGYLLVKLYSDKTKLDCLEYNTNMVCFGDSRMQGVGNSANKCTNIMSKILNCNILNSGYGGTTFSKENDIDGCFVNIVDAIVSNNWNNMDIFMDNFCTTYPQFEYVREFYNKLKTTDFNKVNSVVIAYGTNDWRMGRTLDNSNDQKDTSTILGAFRYCLDKLLTAYPKLRLYVFTPAYRDKLGENSNETCYTYKINGLLLNDVNKELQKVSNSYGIPALNMLENGNVNPYNSTNWLNDGTHCTYDGYDLLGTQYAKFILSH